MQRPWGFRQTHFKIEVLNSVHFATLIEPGASAGAFQPWGKAGARQRACLSVLGCKLQAEPSREAGVRFAGASWNRGEASSFDMAHLFPLAGLT